MATKKTFSNEYRNKAIEYVKEHPDIPISKAANNLNIAPSTLHKWIKASKENNEHLEDVILIGIKNKGLPIAQILADLIYSFEGVKLTVLPLDITKHRDDTKKNPEINIDFNHNIDDKTVILVDDVLFTGRSVRAAMDALMDFGRPKKIQLAILIDRGHRELPIRADYVGKNIPTSRTESIYVDVEKQEVWLN